MKQLSRHCRKLLPNVLVTNLFIASPQWRFYSANSTAKTKVCIVGGGPAGFYVTQHLLKHLPNAEVDIVEKLPVPFGLVRFGVAPDHPEVKNVINTFTKVAESPHVRFCGNLSLGIDFTLKQLRDAYHAVVLCYGAEQDRSLNIPDEEKYVLSAREFVAWYNGLPGADADERHKRIASRLAESRSVSIIGQGNVAIDVARILLSPLDTLRHTDITQQALEALSASRVEQVHVVGRRGPLQAAFTIKELREMLKLPNVQTQWRPDDFTGIDETLIGKMPRPKKRITELMTNSLKSVAAASSNGRTFMPLFFRSPDAIVDGCQLRLMVNELTEKQVAISTDKTELIPSDLVLRSIGYKSINVVGNELNFDSRKGLVPNLKGRVLKVNSNAPAAEVADVEQFDAYFERGLYASGWLASGPIGVILTTMSNSFLVASSVCKDYENVLLSEQTTSKSGLDFDHYPNVVSWENWLKIDKAECERGQQIGKPREKILDVANMLEIAFR